MAVILPDFDPRKDLDQPPSLSASAYIHPCAQVHPSAKIGPNAFVGAFAQIGAKTQIGPGAVIESFCQVGANCVIGANTVIGHSGFGYVEDTQKGYHLPIPQIGNVIIEDFVEIGACCTIDRATLGSTKIGAHTKLDNLVHIAHNCEIGRSCLITAGFTLAGSSKIGNFFVCGGNVSVSDHVKICDGVMIGGLSGVVSDITQPGKYKGYPLQNLSDGLKTLQNLRHLSRFRKDLNLIKKKLGLE
jgi:UDP-3-O-[3-hydroxymyristoyl] glucosamine N-acyltransferase